MDREGFESKSLSPIPSSAFPSVKIPAHMLPTVNLSSKQYLHPGWVVKITLTECKSKNNTPLTHFQKIKEEVEIRTTDLEKQAICSTCG